MTLMVTILGVSAPALSRSFQGRAVKQEAARLLAMAEYAREEAISQGVPMVVWIDAQGGRFGTQAKSGYEGDASRQKELALAPTIHVTLAEEKAPQDGRTIAMEFDPDGTPAPSNISSIKVADQHEEVATLALSNDGWGYEIAKE